jgi:putative oxidoreductase
MKAITLANCAQDFLDKTRKADFLAPLLLRLYLAPVFWVAANNKLNPFNMQSSLQPVVDWFDHGLMLPLPKLMAHLAWATEYFGAILLLLGLATRWISIPLMFTMIVAAGSVHWHNGWQAVHDPSSPWASATAPAAIERLGEAREILRQHGDYEHLTEYGNFVVSNNGIEWAATYFLMLLTLFFIGGGRFVSVDYWVAKPWKRSI